jgi:hypothetical protein
MVKLVVIGLWGILVTAGSLFAMSRFDVFGGSTQHEPKSTITTISTNVMRVPIMAGEKPKGYALVNLDIDFDAEAAREVIGKLPSLAVDEAFRAVYDSVAIDFEKAEKTDLSALLAAIGERLNKRVGVSIVKEIRIKEFMYVPPRTSKAERSRAMTGE